MFDRTKQTLALGLLCAAIWSCSSNIEKPDLSIPKTLPRVEVTTALGTVRGVQEGGILAFYGIPYAAPFSGLERFLPPKDPVPFDGIFDATAYGQACAQVETTLPTWLVSDKAERFMAYVGYEQVAAQKKGPDCLNLNIWTPSLPDPADASPTTADDETIDAPAVHGVVADQPGDGGSAALAVDGGPADLPGDGGPDGAAVGDGGVASEPIADAAPVPPAETTPKGHPVMVFLHGGGMNQGSSQSAYVHGANLAQKGVVVVNINYRLGIQGFLTGESLFEGATEGDILVPNRGIMDMIAALRWVREHIKSFGGDPDRVTLVGESGGGFGVWAVLAAPSADGLVHRAIVHSAAPFLTPAADLEKVSKDVLHDLDIAPGDEKALAALPDEDIPHTILSQKIAGGGDYGFLSQTNMPFNGTYGTELIPDDVVPAILAGRASQVDLMIGINKDETKGLSIMVPLIPESFATDLVTSFVAGAIAPTEEARERVNNGYETVLMPDASSLERTEQIIQDGFFRQPAIRAAEARQKAGGEGKTYLWEFHWESPCCDGEVGAIHALELAFAYDNLHSAEMLTLGDATAQPLATAMSDAWASFAKTGVPSSEGLPSWPAYDDKTRHTMVFDRQSAVVQDFEKERRLFWNEEYARWK